VKLSKPNWMMERIENWAGMGFPDVFINADGTFHLLELKATFHNAVGLRPHQVAFHTRHANSSSWILVKHLYKGNARTFDLFLYHAAQARDVANDGLKTKPVLKIAHSDDWAQIMETIEMGKSDVIYYGMDTETLKPSS